MPDSRTQTLLLPSGAQRLRWGELYGLLEDATDRAEDIGDRLGAIVAKYA